MTDAMKELSGHDDGEELLDTAGQPTGEIAVADYDEDDNLIGWHKEVRKGKK